MPFFIVGAARYWRALSGRSTGSVYSGGTSALVPFQEGTGTFISCSFGSCRWHPSRTTWFSSTNMKTLETKDTYSTRLISIAPLGLAPAYLLPGADTLPNGHHIRHKTRSLCLCNTSRDIQTSRKKKIPPQQNRSLFFI